MPRTTARARRAAITAPSLLLGAGLALAAAALTPARGEAQLFKKLKEAAAQKAASTIGEKAVDKATDKATDKAAAKAGVETRGRARPADLSALGGPVTADTLDMLLKGLDALAASMDARDRLSEEQVAANNRAGELRSHPAVEQWHERERAIGNCREEFADALKERRQADYEAKAKADPAKYMAAGIRFAQQMAPLQMAGDTAGMRRLQQQFEKELYGIDSSGDAAAATRKCGAVPPKPVQFAEIEKAERQAKQLAEQLRTLESGADAKAAAASGISAQRFAQLRERVYLWSTRGKWVAFPEGDLLEQRRDAIERVKRAL